MPKVWPVHKVSEVMSGKENNKELWLKGCNMNGTEIWLLESANDTVLYETKNQYISKGNYYYDTPVYHVWQSDKWIVATENYVEAYNIWETIKNKER